MADRVFRGQVSGVKRIRAPATLQCYLTTSVTNAPHDALLKTIFGSARTRRGRDASEEPVCPDPSNRRCAHRCRVSNAIVLSYLARLPLGLGSPPVRPRAGSACTRDANALRASPSAPPVSTGNYKRNLLPARAHPISSLHPIPALHTIAMRMKTAAQTRRALDERAANAEAKAAGLPMPHPNPWDSLMHKLPDDASHEEQMQWCADLAERYAPRP